MKNQIIMIAPINQIQMGSYIITTSENDVLVIDGGWRVDALNLIEHLKEATGMDVPKVDAWILSHPHSDHIEAFLEINEKYSDRISFNGPLYYNFPSEQFLAKKDKEAKVTVREFYDALPTFAHKTCIVSGGDTYNVGTIKVEFLNSPDYTLDREVCNNASLVTKITVAGKTVLFTADCGYELGKKLLERYGESGILKCDICQMAHHGQGGADRDFYEAVNPEICLWPTPIHLWNNDAGLGYNTHEWKTIETRTWMEELGVKKNYVTKDGTQVCPLD